MANSAEQNQPSTNRDIINYHGSKLLSWLAFSAVVIATLFQIYFSFTSSYSAQAVFFLLFFSCSSILLFLILFIKKRHRPHYCFTTVFLLSTFTMLITWRISVLIDMPVVKYIFLVAFIAKILNYVVCAHNDIKEQKEKRSDNGFHHNNKYEWQLFFVRMVIGFIFVPHFTEKLFAGPVIRADDIHAFIQLGVPHALSFVYFAGVLEFCSCFAIGCGFLTRLGAIGAFTYMMVATIMGHHFSIGFIWASPGGGWEYPALWGTLLLSFAILGADTFSLDTALKNAFKLPRWLKFLMG